MPQMAPPAKPAPFFSTLSRCAAGTDLTLATPWMSTNCASTYLTLLSLRNFFASASDFIDPSFELGSEPTMIDCTDAASASAKDFINLSFEYKDAVRARP